MQTAFQARQRILAGLQPVNVETVWLYDQQTGPQPSPGFGWRHSKCCQVELSPCSSYLAVVLQGRQKKQQTRSRKHGLVYVYHVLLYSVSEGCSEQARFYTGQSQPTILWSGGPLGYLCIAQLLGNKASMYEICRQADGDGFAYSLQSATLLWDPRTIRPLRSLSETPSSALCALAAGCQFYPVWSPSCHLLLITAREPGSLGDGHYQGWVLVVDVAKNRVIARSKITAGPNQDKISDAVSWHPSSTGLIFTSDVRMLDTGPFLQAGVALGALPPHLTVHAAGFCADATYLVASTNSPRHSPAQEVLLRCSMEGLHIRFEEVQALDIGNIQYMGWLKACSVLFMIRTTTQGSEIVYLRWRYSDQAGVFEPWRFGHRALERTQPGTSYCMSRRFSPSGRFFVACTSPSLRIVDVKKGHLCWEGIDALTGLPMPSASALHGCPSSSQQAHIHFDFCGWLPSGHGFVCSTWESFRGDQHAPCTPPALHFYRFADCS